MRILTVVLAALLVAPTMVWAKDNCMENDNIYWLDQNRDLYDRLMGFMSCSDDGSDPTACNVFVDKVAQNIHGVTDFSVDGQAMSANAMLDYVRTHDDAHGGLWSKLGNAATQSVLNDAAQGAGNHLVIALLPGDPHGHVAVILPGDLQASGWGLQVPNSAAFKINDASAAYVFCRLSASFRNTEKANVEIWWRPDGSH